LPGPVATFKEAGEAPRRRDHGHRRRHDDAPRLRRVRPRRAGRHHRGQPGRSHRGAAQRGGLPDHRPADDASIAWFPLAILLFKPSETAIMFVMVLGAAPAIANGLIAGTDHIPRSCCGRAGVGGQGSVPVPSRDPAGVAACLSHGAEAGLGLRLAQPDGRRAAGDHRQPPLIGSSWRTLASSPTPVGSWRPWW